MGKFRSPSALQCTLAISRRFQSMGGLPSQQSSYTFIWAAFDKNKETWHDKLFDTWVVID